MEPLEWTTDDDKSAPIVATRKRRLRSTRCSKPGCNNQSNGYSQYCKAHHREYMRQYRARKKAELEEMKRLLLQQK